MGNLSYDVDEDALMSAFTDNDFHPVSVRVITQRDGQSKGLVASYAI